MRSIVGGNVKKITPRKWNIFAAERIEIPPKESKTILLNFGIELAREGCCIIALDNNWRTQDLSIQNCVVLQSTENISIVVRNNLNKNIFIGKDESLCFLYCVI